MIFLSISANLFLDALQTLVKLDAAEEQPLAKNQELARVRHWLERLLRHRHGHQRERVDENQLFLFAVEMASLGQDPRRSRRQRKRSPSAR